MVATGWGLWKFYFTLSDWKGVYTTVMLPEDNDRGDRGQSQCKRRLPLFLGRIICCQLLFGSEMGNGRVPTARSVEDSRRRRLGSTAPPHTRQQYGWRLTTTLPPQYPHNLTRQKCPVRLCMCHIRPLGRSYYLQTVRPLTPALRTRAGAAPLWPPHMPAELPQPPHQLCSFPWP